MLFPPIVSLLMENGGAILVDCLITDHRTAARCRRENPKGENEDQVPEVYSS